MARWRSNVAPLRKVALEIELVGSQWQQGYDNIANLWRKEKYCKTIYTRCNNMLLRTDETEQRNKTRTTGRQHHQADSELTCRL